MNDKERDVVRWVPHESGQSPLEAARALYPEKTDEQILGYVKNHLDGDPEPRPDELQEVNQMRKDQGLDEIMMIVVTGKDLTDWHAWTVSEDAYGEPVYEPGEIKIIPDEIKDDFGGGKGTSHLEGPKLGSDIRRASE